MTVRDLTTDEQLAIAIRLRDFLDSEAFRLRRRAETPHDRQLAIQMEDLADQASDLVVNLRLRRGTDDRPADA